MSLIEDINDAITNATNLTKSVEGDISNLIDNLDELTEEPLYDFRLSHSSIGSIEPATFIPGTIGSAPSSPKFTGIMPPAPSLNPIDTSLDVTSHMVGDAPTIADIAIPDIDLYQLNSIIVPTLNSVNVPNAPVFDLPTSPIYQDISIPDVPDFTTIPTFEGTAPGHIDAPSIPTLVFNEEEYLSTLKDASEAWLANIISTGGTGLSPEVEQAIFDRALTREITAFRENIELATDQYSGSGFPRPGGALRAQTDKIRADYQNRIEDLNRKILEDQEKLAQENIQFAISESGKLESIKMQLHNNIADRAIEFAKAVVATHESVYALKIAEYNGKIDLFKAEATVHKDLISAIALEVEAYKAEVDAAKIGSEAQKAKAEIYTASMQGLRYLADMYTAQVNATKVESEIENLKLEKYRVEVDAAKIHIDAQAKQIDSSQIKLDAQRLKLDIYSTEVDGVRSANDTERLKLDTRRTQIEIQLALNQKTLDSYRAVVDAYRLAVSSHQAEVQAFEASQNVILEYARKDSSDSDLSAKVEISNAQIQIERGKANAELYNLQKRHEADVNVKQLEARISGASEGIRHMSTISAAAISQLNTIIQTSSEVTES